MWGKSNWLVNNPQWAILRHSVQTLASCCNFYSYHHIGDSYVGACLFEQFPNQWLLYVTWSLSFDNCTLCVPSAFMFFSDSKGVLPYKAISVWISSGFSFYCFKSFQNIIFESMQTYTWKKKRCFSLYIILLMILQLGGLGNLIGGITTAASADYFHDSESRNGKLDFCSPWSNREVSVTAWRNLRKERYKHYSH